MYPEPINFGNLPIWIQSAIGVDPVFAKLLSVIIVLMPIFIMFMLLKAPTFLWYITSVLFMGVFTIVGWIPFYMWIFIGVYFAIMVSRKWKTWI